MVPHPRLRPESAQESWLGPAGYQHVVIPLRAHPPSFLGPCRRRIFIFSRGKPLGWGWYCCDKTSSLVTLAKSFISSLSRSLHVPVDRGLVSDTRGFVMSGCFLLSGWGFDPLSTEELLIYIGSRSPLQLALSRARFDIHPKVHHAFSTGSSNVSVPTK